jgi:hypothetical protein
MRANAPGRQAAVARLLVAVLLFVSAGPLLHAVEGHEAEFAALLDRHDCAQHDRDLAAPDEAALPDVHCAVCHFGRQARSVPGQSGVFHLFVASGRLAPEPVRAPRAIVVLPLPARAPPAPSFA